VENLIKALSDEVDLTQDAVRRLQAARANKNRALELSTDAEVNMQFEKLRARLCEIRRRLGL